MEPVSYLVCPTCRAVSGEEGTLVHEVGCAMAGVEAYATRAEALARGVGLWFASLRGVGPDRAGDGLQPVDYTDPYFREGR